MFTIYMYKTIFDGLLKKDYLSKHMSCVLE